MNENIINLQGANLADWLIAIGTISIAIIAVFQDKIRQWINRPKLTIEFDMSPPYCVKTPYRVKTPAGEINTNSYYYRLKIINEGSSRAELVEAYVAEINKLSMNNSYEKLTRFQPMNLTWTNSKSTYQSAISPGMPKLLDIGHIVEPIARPKIELEHDPSLEKDKTIFCLETEVKSFSLSHLLAPGKYKLEILFGMSNGKPQKKIINLNISGNWYNREEDMIKDGLGISIN